MRWLSAHGYHAVTLGQVFRYWRDGVALPKRPVVVSFDDGYLSDYAVALPALRRFGWAGVLNLVVANVVPGDITAWQVRQLIKAGWEIDAHTISHVDLTGLDATRLQHEVAGSRVQLRHMFGQPVDFFCYPAGRYDAQVVAAWVGAAWCAGRFTSRYAAATPPPTTTKRVTPTAKRLTTPIVSLARDFRYREPGSCSAESSPELCCWVSPRALPRPRARPRRC